MEKRGAPEQQVLSFAREQEFRAAREQLQYPAKVEVYKLGDHFEGLPFDLAEITLLDTTQVPGCHYGAVNIFVPIIHDLETMRGSGKTAVNPDNAILVESSTGNGWVAFSDAATMLGYEHVVVMPDGLPKQRYRHPEGRIVSIIKTPQEDYAKGMPPQLEGLLAQDLQRIQEKKKIYVSPNHAVGKRSKDITVQTMSDLGKRLLWEMGTSADPIRVVISMGNGASLCAIGEYVKEHSPNAKVVATESLAYGGGYDKFAHARKLPRYEELYGITPGNANLMKQFKTYGTNVEMKMDLPLQTRALKGPPFNGALIDNYELFTDSAVLEAYKSLQETESFRANAENLPNYDALPQVLSKVYGNSTLANIAVARGFTSRGERVVAMAYDSRKNY